MQHMKRLLSATILDNSLPGLKVDDVVSSGESLVLAAEESIIHVIHVMSHI